MIAFLAPLPVENVIAAYVNRSHSERTMFIKPKKAYICILIEFSAMGS